VPDAGFEDPAEFFTTIFGGEAFVDLIGEISLIKDLTKTMEIAGLDDDESVMSEKTANAETVPGQTSENVHHNQYESPRVPTPDYPRSSGTSTPLASITAGASSDVASESSKLDEKKKKKKTSSLSKEQRAELEQYEQERKIARDERVATLQKKLVDKLGVWTETGKGDAVTKAFQEKLRLEAEELKMESFGIELLHAIGQTYYTKASTFLKSQKFLGISGFFSKVKEKGTLAKDTWNTISSALDAQSSMQEMAKAEELGGDDWTTERKAEMERTLLGKILTAAWNGSRFEVQSVLREVCDTVLYDKSVPLTKRIERAQALIIMGTVFKRAERTAEEAAEAQMFEELVAEAAASKKKKKNKNAHKADTTV
jgi:X-domain of DnaJ-containing